MLVRYSMNYFDLLSTAWVNRTHCHHSSYHPLHSDTHTHTHTHINSHTHLYKIWFIQFNVEHDDLHSFVLCLLFWGIETLGHHARHHLIDCSAAAGSKHSNTTVSVTSSLRKLRLYWARPFFFCLCPNCWGKIISVVLVWLTHCTQPLRKMGQGGRAGGSQWQCLSKQCNNNSTKNRFTLQQSVWKHSLQRRWPSPCLSPGQQHYYLWQPSSSAQHIWRTLGSSRSPRKQKSWSSLRIQLNGPSIPAQIHFHHHYRSVITFFISIIDLW